MRFLCILGISTLVICGAGRAQDSIPRTVDLSGHISGGATSYSDLTVQLRSGTTVKNATVYGNGDFEFDSVREGQYTASVLDFSGDVVWQGDVSVQGFGNVPLAIQLPDRSRRERPASGTVSLHALGHEVPKAALKEYRSGNEAFEHADYEKAAKHFEKALSKDPAFVSAYNDLAAAYSKMGRDAEALEELRKAYEIDPNSASVNLNLGAGLLRANQFAEAEKAARRALELNPDLQQADVIVGLCLKAQNGDAEQALFYLLRGAAKFPEARLTAADILQQKGKRNEAIEQVKKYLETNHDPKRREQVEQWLAKLQ